MSSRTGIEWAHSTFSPWTGCTKISPGCDHCYAEALSRRFPAVFGVWGASTQRKRTSRTTWEAVRRWNRQAAEAGGRRRVFPSMCDIFDNQAAQQDRTDFWQLVRETPHLDWLILTKRIQNARKMLPVPMPPNVWLGVTAENQAEADRRISVLRSLTTMVRFVCVEPMLGPVQLKLEGIGWLIVGGESGPHARPLPAEWARGVRDQCRAANVPFFMKQMSGRTAIPTDLLIREFPVIR